MHAGNISVCDRIASDMREVTPDPFEDRPAFKTQMNRLSDAVRERDRLLPLVLDISAKTHEGIAMKARVIGALFSDKSGIRGAAVRSLAVDVASVMGAQKHDVQKPPRRRRRRRQSAVVTRDFGHGESVPSLSILQIVVSAALAGLVIMPDGEGDSGPHRDLGKTSVEPRQGLTFISLKMSTCTNAPLVGAKAAVGIWRGVRLTRNYAAPGSRPR